MKYYALSGLGADYRVFDQLNLNFELEHISYIDPKKNESLASYSKRLINQINKNKPVTLIGVSFGGILAIEISKQINVKQLVLISSVASSKELPISIQLLKKFNFTKFIHHSLFKPPTFIMYWLFGAKNKQLLKQILNDTDSRFAKWAILNLISWKGMKNENSIHFQIIGSSDKFFNHKKMNEPIVVESGEHFMVVDKAPEISRIINDFVYS